MGALALLAIAAAAAFTRVPAALRQVP